MGNVNCCQNHDQQTTDKPPNEAPLKKNQASTNDPKVVQTFNKP